MQKFLSEYYSDDAKRKAVIVAGPNGERWVEMWEDQAKVETRDVSAYTLRYAEDCADNWVIGVIR